MELRGLKSVQRPSKRYSVRSRKKKKKSERDRSLRCTKKRAKLPRKSRDHFKQRRSEMKSAWGGSEWRPWLSKPTTTRQSLTNSQITASKTLRTHTLMSSAQRRLKKSSKSSQSLFRERIRNFRTRMICSASLDGISSRYAMRGRRI